MPNNEGKERKGNVDVVRKRCGRFCFDCDLFTEAPLDVRRVSGFAAEIRIDASA
jgi:hypothetical protein